MLDRVCRRSSQRSKSLAPNELARWFRTSRSSLVVEGDEADKKEDDEFDEVVVANEAGTTLP